MSNTSVYQLFYQLCDIFAGDTITQGVTLRKERSSHDRKILNKQLLAIAYQQLLFGGLNSWANGDHANESFHHNSSNHWRFIAYGMYLSYAKRQQDAVKLDTLLNQLLDRVGDTQQILSFLLLMAGNTIESDFAMEDFGSKQNVTQKIPTEPRLCGTPLQLTNCNQFFAPDYDIICDPSKYPFLTKFNMLPNNQFKQPSNVEWNKAGSNLFGGIVHSNVYHLNELPQCSNAERYLVARKNHNKTSSSSLPIMVADRTKELNEGHESYLNWDDTFIVGEALCNHYYEWEIRGRKSCSRKFYMSESGHNSLELALLNRLKYATKAFRLDCPATYMTEEQLVKDAVNVLLGIPSKTFMFQNDKNAVGKFYVRADVYLSGRSSSSLVKLLKEIGDIGTCYVHLRDFMRSGTNTAGLVVNAFNIDSNRFNKLLAAVCFALHGPREDNDQTRLLTGVKLIDTIYHMALDAEDTHNYMLLVYILVNICQPYLDYIRNWVTKGLHTDYYDEFVLEVDSTYLSVQDRSFWNNGFKMRKGIIDDTVPILSHDCLQDILVCGKSLYLLRQCCPNHIILATDPPLFKFVLNEEDINTAMTALMEYKEKIRNLQEFEDKKRKEEIMNKEKVKRAILLEEQAVIAEKIKKRKRMQLEERRLLQASKENQLNQIKRQIEDHQQKQKIRVTEEMLSEQQEISVNQQHQFTTASIAPKLKDDVREALESHYEELSLEASKREFLARWQSSRFQLHEKRKKFYDDSIVKLQGALQSYGHQDSATADVAMHDGIIKESSSSVKSQYSEEESSSIQDLRDSPVNPELISVAVSDYESPDSYAKDAITSSLKPKNNNYEALVTNNVTPENTISKADAIIRPLKSNTIELNVESDELDQMRRTSSKNSVVSGKIALIEDKGKPLSNGAQEIKSQISSKQQYLQNDPGNQDLLRTNSYNPLEIAKSLSIQKEETVVINDSFMTDCLGSLPNNAVNQSRILGDDCINNSNNSMQSNSESLLNVKLTKRTRGELTLDNRTAENPKSIPTLSLETIMRKAVVPQLRLQISLVNDAVLRYFKDDLDIYRHIEILRSLLLMADSEFSMSLTSQLFDKLASGKSVHVIYTVTELTEILNTAISQSGFKEIELISRNTTLVMKPMTEVFQSTSIHALNFLDLKYKVPWPCNIIITDSCLTVYSKIWSFLLQLKRVAWALRDCWLRLKCALHGRQVGSFQYSRLQHFRYEMLHFVNVIQSYFENQIITVCWEEFKQCVAKARNLDELYSYHMEYLKKGEYRSLLGSKAKPVMQIISSIFGVIINFHFNLTMGSWIVDLNGELIHTSFVKLEEFYERFREYCKFLFLVVHKLIRRGYQAYLEDFVLRINFNSIYSGENSI
ncbi:Gamma-tubulin complex component 6 [Trichoplax sp. H2]|nr:Gamma-tubulin complex component 6 [Trichoplax sp. H2]|eukprot:RDD47083.1 Gamma-tubulin complex component 6 [Trichoplax sp. H2]